MGDRAEAVTYVRFDHETAVATQGHHTISQGLQGVVRRAPGAKPIRAVQKVLLVQRFEHHDDGALQHLVFEGRDPEWPKSTIGLWDVHAAHRRSAVSP